MTTDFEQEPTQNDKVPEVKKVHHREKTGSKSYASLPFSFIKDGNSYEQSFDHNGLPNWLKFSAGSLEQERQSAEVVGKSFQLKSPESILLTDGPGKIQSSEELYCRIKDLLNRIHLFEASYQVEFLSLYILSTWMYDRYPYLSYIGLSGSPGANKSGLLNAMENLVYAGFRVTGSATEAVVFRRLNESRGTFLQDEAQKDLESTSSRLHKILTEGNAFNGAVEVAVPSNDGDFVTKKFVVFGPKVFASRGMPDDEAILSRTTELHLPVLSEDPCLEKAMEISWRNDAQELKRDLTFYRQRKLVGDLNLSLTPSSFSASKENLKSRLKLSGREKQVYLWLFEECPCSEALHSLGDIIRYQREKLIEDRLLLPEIQILQCCLQLTKPATFAEIAASASAQGVVVTAKLVGKVLRSNRLHIKRTNKGLALIAENSLITKVLMNHGLFSREISSLNRIDQEGQDNK